ncbi:neuropeptides capa receptor-like isoform X1 [Haliotis rufescens]|uniref:neuropeptides capa receptor-like isoform X1 n=1 Tax=Haliotis rufescens TaxID=6454 RepID=UPI00201F8097|nr:neuropeptides capa receptor-like isoform X1 [Haliotis rufescens]
MMSGYSSLLNTTSLLITGAPGSTENLQNKPVVDMERLNVSVNISQNESDFNEKEYLEIYLGMRHIRNDVVIFLTVVYVVIFISGIVGNVLTCFVVLRNKYMHTTTNFYLLSLAASDVLTLLLALPPDVSTIWEAYPWRFGLGFCIIKSFVSEMTAYASVLTITAFTIERYVAICHPLKAHSWSSLSRAVRIILLIWTVACGLALPYPIHARTFYGVQHPQTGENLEDSLLCNIPVDFRERMKYMFQFSTFAFFVIPMVVITIMYVLIGVRLWKSQMAVDEKKNKTAAEAASKARKAVLKMLVAVVIAFFVCWAPFHTQRLMTIYIPQERWTDDLLRLQTYIFYISGLLYFVSSVVNPILYNVLSKKYRTAFKRTLCQCWPKSGYTNDMSVYKSSRSCGTSVTIYTNHKLLPKEKSRILNSDSEIVHSAL